MKIRATEAIMECLLEQEVDTIFGYPGGTILNLYDELYRYQGKIRHILTAHEQGAAHAADGYARSTGKVGVCFFKLYNIVLVLPNIEMNLPQVYLCSP